MSDDSELGLVRVNTPNPSLQAPMEWQLDLQ